MAASRPGMSDPPPANRDGICAEGSLVWRPAAKPPARLARYPALTNPQTKRPPHTACLALCLLLAALAGCRTQQDAAAAADQMQETAATLTSYYLALGHVAELTQDASQVENALNGFGPVTPQQIAVLDETRHQMVLRARMAREIEQLSALFEKLARSSAAKDASTATGKLDAELVSVKALADNSTETQALTTGMQQIVLLLQQHEEVKAARKMAPLCHNLSAFFDSERAQYDTLNEAYLKLARSDAKTLVTSGQADAASIFRSAADPFGLTPGITDARTRDALKPYLLDQVERRYQLRIHAGTDATAYLSDALKEMTRRIDLLAADKPMSLRNPPPTLAEVKTWATDLMK